MKTFYVIVKIRVQLMTIGIAFAPLASKPVNIMYNTNTILYIDIKLNIYFVAIEYRFNLHVVDLCAC